MTCEHHCRSSNREWRRCKSFNGGGVRIITRNQARDEGGVSNATGFHQGMEAV